MNKKKYIDKIDSLKNDSNPFTQSQVVNGLLYFNENKKALNVATEIYNKEIQSIQIDSISSTGTYTYRTLIKLLDDYPDEILPKLLNLYEAYRTLYPIEMPIGESWFAASKICDSKTYKRIESLQGADESILNFITRYQLKANHQSESSTMQKFSMYIDQRDAFLESIMDMN